MAFAKTCRCGRRVAPKTTCACGAGSEAERNRTQPYRAAYRLPSYRRNRMARYRLAKGRCERCGVELRGPLYPDGVSWQCDHHVEASRFTDPEQANATENLRVYCTGRKGCHTGSRKPQ